MFDVKHRFVGFKGGYGSGKSMAFVHKGILCAKRNPGKLGALLEPIASMVLTDLVPTWEKVLDSVLGESNWTCTSRSHLTYELRFPYQKPSKVILLSAENHTRLRGKNFAWAGVDEFDTIQPRSLQNLVLEQLMARIRTGDSDEQEQLFFVSTPEGFSGMYDFFVTEELKLQLAAEALGEIYVPDRVIYTASTRESYLLKPSYIKSMEQKYPAQLLAAYIDGEFVNMTRGSVYPKFDKVENNTTSTWRHFKDYPLQIGMDFNVRAMSVTVSAVANEQLFVVDELIGDRNTPDAIESIKRRDWYHDDLEFYIHPDKTGKAEDSTAPSSDHTLLQAAFGSDRVILEDDMGRVANPWVKDRVNAVNARILNGSTRNLFVNQRTCPHTFDSLLMQPYGKDEKPLKDGKLDGPADALGYTVWGFWPLRSHHSTHAGDFY